MDVLLVSIIALVVGVALVVWWLVVLIEALRTPSEVWQRAGQSQLIYILLMVFLGIVGTIVYIAVARPQLRRVGGVVPSS